MDTWVHDVRFAARSLVRKPLFTGVVLATLAVGIGANTAIFSVVDQLMIRALPYEDGDRVVTVWGRDLEAGGEIEEVAPGDFFDWREQTRTIEHMAAADPWSLDLTGLERPEVLFAARVTEDFFEALGVDAALGRTFRAEDFLPGAGRVIVLNHSLWERRLGADPGLVGESIELDGEPVTVAGVLPEWFNPRLVPAATDREAWIPLIPQGWEEQEHESGWWNVVGRLAPGVTLEQARAEMRTIARRVATEHPGTNARRGATVVPLRDHLLGDAGTALLILQGAVGILLLIACANVANLLLARAADRERELAVRTALGASRGHLVRLLITEGFILALVAGAIGVLLAGWGVEVITRSSPVVLPGLQEAGIDGRVLTFTVILATLTTLIFGLVPALHVYRADLRAAMTGGRSATAGRRRQRMRNGLVVGEVALALVLVAGAALLARSLGSLLRVDPGFEPDGVTVVQVFAGEATEDADERQQFMAEVLQRLRATPDVVSAGAVMALPFIESNINVEASFTIAGRPSPRSGEEPSAHVSVATPGYFRTLRVPLREGRLFEDGDDPTASPVALVTESLARRYWGADSPVGDRVTLEASGSPTELEIVGVLGDVRHDGLDRAPRREIFVPHAQAPTGSMTFVARSRNDAATLVPIMRERIWAVNPRQPVYRSATMEELVASSVEVRTFNLWLFGLFGTVALLLAALGIYGVTSYMARTRTREIGVRTALGASPRDVLRQVLWRGLKLASIGVAIGLVVALGLTRFLSGLLYGVGPGDPLTLAAVSLLLTAVAVAASWLPARRATRVDPVTALRVE